MKKLLMMLMALPMLMMSCNDEMALSEETVEVSFEAEIPAFVGTRAVDGLTVNKLVCAVFENGQEIVGHRTTIDVTSASGITYSPRLVKGRTYKVVFWAMRDDKYNVTDMTRITRSDSANEADYDAFTATSEVTVVNAESKSVSLTRPLAQLNIGITEEDWTTASNIFGQTPKTCTISYTAKDAFNALEGVAVGNDEVVFRTVVASRNDLTVGGVVYKHLGSCYVLMAEDNKTNLDLTLSVLDQNTLAQSIRENVQIQNVPFQRNYQTNLVGGLLTGTVTYSVSIQQDFSSGENNKEI